MIPAMIVPFVAALVALGLAGCIEPNRPRFVTDLVDTAVEDTEVEQETVEDGVLGEVDTDPGECTGDNDCPRAARACDMLACIDSKCVERPRGNGASCDDGNRCRGDGVCSDGACLPGVEAVVDGTPCDNDELACNGVSTCVNGECVIALPPTCDDSGAQCADGGICSEALGGVCVDLPAADGLACDGPASREGLAVWKCSAGQCVPPDMVFVAGGVFTMGCPPGYCSVTNDNAPEHEVRLSPYAIDRTEVSEDEFRRCRDDLDLRGFPCAPRLNEAQDEVTSQAGNAPLRWVDWAGAEAVCAYQDKRLCTEAEWEYAARGVGAAFYPWGNLPPTCERATFFDEGAAGCGTGLPTGVGTKPLGASTFGALDMAGNVSEWCADFYRADVYGTRTGTPLDPVQQALAGTDSHVVRGGSYTKGVAEIRVFARGAEQSGVADKGLGVRCCLSLNAP